MRGGLTAWAALLIGLPILQIYAAATGRIEGRVARVEGQGLPGVAVALDETAEIRLTDDHGYFEFDRVPAATYTLTFAMLDMSASLRDVVVEPGATTELEQRVDWPVSVVETITVRSVSRYPERLIEAPAAVTRISQNDIARRAAQGQVPKLLEFTPGVGITQSGLYDFNISTRGFNGALSRRVPVLQDGRDTTDPFTHSPEWATLSFPLDTLSSVELLRGPSATMWGPNATSGVLSLNSREPRENLGGDLRIARGELDSTNVDLRWATGLGRDWYLQVAGSERRAEDFAVSRLGGVEYSTACTGPGQRDCLVRDGVPFPREEITISNLALRLDKHLEGGGTVTVEGGTNEYEGTVFLNPGGTRGMMNEATREWASAHYSRGNWNVLAYYNGRESDSSNLTNGAPFRLDAYHARLEAEWNRSFADDRVRLIAGARYGDETVKATAVKGGRVDNEQQALFAQVDWTVHRDIDLLAGARWDDADTYASSQVSPRTGIVWRTRPGHQVYLTYNEGFQVPTFTDFLLRFPTPPSPTAAPVLAATLQQLESDICTAVGVECGLATSPVLAVGNDGLDLEETKTVEFGYSGLIRKKGLLTLDLYSTENSNFVTALQFQTGPAGPVNTNLGPWAPSPGFTLPASVVEQVNAAAPDALAAAGFPWQLTTVDGQSTIVSLSNTNVGQVDTRGAELSFRYYPRDRWTIDFAYAWFEFDDNGGAAVSLPANAAENRLAASLTYARKRWNASISGRWTDDFRWLNGILQGNVESYASTDLVGSYSLDRHWTIGLNVANVFDDHHWQAFGGAITGRRALGYATFSW